MPVLDPTKCFPNLAFSLELNPAAIFPHKIFVQGERNIDSTSLSDASGNCMIRDLDQFLNLLPCVLEADSDGIALEPVTPQIVFHNVAGDLLRASVGVKGEYVKNEKRRLLGRRAKALSPE